MTFLIGLFSILLSAEISSAKQDSVLVEFHRNPSVAMDRLPAQVVGSLVIERGSIGYSGLNGTTFTEKMNVRSTIMSRGRSSFGLLSTMGGKDHPQSLIDNEQIVSNIYDIDRRGLSRSILENPPWADSYWPLHKGLIAVRYAENGFPNSKTWLDNYSYFLSHPALPIYNTGSVKLINDLSPAEKYDLLLGDQKLTLTNYSWNAGKKYFDKYGYVEKWMGICHGWAAAAHMLAPNITQPVTLYTPQGVPVTFYQSDVKALNSMLWANASPATRFVGQRCKTPHPPKNDVGRILDEGCWDTNPATFHLSLVNQVGISKRSFVMDSTYDAEVWNFAIVSYRFTYFNPQNLRPTPIIQQAVLPIEKYTLDKFKEFRAPEAKQVVGVILDVTHVNALNPTHGILTKNATKTLRYYYDLELDANGTVIGGEWYTSAHPDFIWTFAPGAQARARVDGELESDVWNLSEPVPAHWSSAAQRASSAGIPLYNVIRRIVSGPQAPPPVVGPPVAAVPNPAIAR